MFPCVLIASSPLVEVLHSGAPVAPSIQGHGCILEVISMSNVLMSLQTSSPRSSCAVSQRKPGSASFTKHWDIFSRFCGSASGSWRAGANLIVGWPRQIHRTRECNECVKFHRQVVNYRSLIGPSTRCRAMLFCSPAGNKVCITINVLLIRILKVR